MCSVRVNHRLQVSDSRSIKLDDSVSIVVCMMGATAITFDDIPNAVASGGPIPSGYKGFSWTNGGYLNIASFNSSGYRYTISSGGFFSWFNTPLVLQLIAGNQTFTLNSRIMSAGWSNSISVGIIAYYSSTPLYNMTIPLNTYTKVIQVFNWPGLTRVVFNPFGSGYVDTGIDNVCVTY